MRKILLIAIITFYSINVSALNLNVGALCNGESSAQSDEEMNAAAIITNHFTSKGENLYECLGWLSPKGDNEWFFVNGDLSVHGFNSDTKQHIGNWPLTRWPNQHIIPEVKQRYDDNHWDYPEEKYSTGHSVAIGCYQNTPLRYGDIDNDNQNELVLFLASDMVVFSPQSNKIIFAETLGLYDWLTLEETAQEIAYETPRDEVTVQYLSSIIVSNTDKSEAGYRGYSKLYFGDFNDNGTADILVWRKLYKSRQINDPVKGFIKLNDNWQHFEKEIGETASGEYIPQTTEQTDIKTWLDAKQLTWQKGYPSQSECAGQENQLIPEMHDPLLNDPDVLK